MSILRARPGQDWLRPSAWVGMRAKLFRNGRSQAVRLPASCRFEGTEVDVERDPETGIVTLRPLRSSPLDWLRQRAVLLDEDPQAVDGFSALMERESTPEPPQRRDWP